MKHLSIFLACAAVAVAFSSCTEDRDPVYQNPTTFELLQPVMGQQYITLSEGSQLEIVAKAQPDYGYSAVTTYSAEVSLTPDFAEPYAIDATGDTKNLSRFMLNQADVATAMCVLHGYTEDNFPKDVDFEPLYVRGVAQLEGVDGSRIVSKNVICFEHVKAYFAIPTPGYIYLVGAPSGWKCPDESVADAMAPWRLFEADDAIGSKIYSGVFDINAGDALFRFYTALTGWDADSYGSQVDDNPIQFPDFTSGTFANELVKGKGSFEFPNWPGGKMTIIVDMSVKDSYTVTIMEGEHHVGATKYVYLVGAINGWPTPSEDNADALAPYRLSDADGTGVYTGTFNFPTTKDKNFKIYGELAGWDGLVYGAGPDDQNYDITLTNKAYSGPVASGKGNWNITGWEGGEMSITLDTNAMTISMTAK